jgi:hypothetical protein
MKIIGRKFLIDSAKLKTFHFSNKLKLCDDGYLKKEEIFFLNIKRDYVKFNFIRWLARIFITTVIKFKDLKSF